MTKRKDVNEKCPATGMTQWVHVSANKQTARLTVANFGAYCAIELSPAALREVALAALAIAEVIER